MDVLLIGHYGRNNLGDDAMLEGILKGLPAGVVPTVAANNKIDGVTTVEEFTYAFLKAILKTDWMFIGGGTFIHDEMSNKRFKNRGLYKILLLLLLAKFFRTKIALIGMGIGPIYTQNTKRFCKILFKSVDFISVRDDHSIEEIDKCVKGIEVKKTFDSAVLLEDHFGNNGSFDEGKKIIGLNILPYFQIYRGNEELDENIVTEITDAFMLFEKENIEINVYVFNIKREESERKIANKLKQKLNDKFDINIIPHKKPQDIIDSIAKCSLFIGMRYHSIVLSYLANVPIIPIAYHKKCISISDEIGLSRELIIEVERLKAEKLAQKIQSVLKDPVSHKQTLAIEKARWLFQGNYFPI